ncbi:MAG: hypothetical protein KGL39_15460 [Patescibacteria group bacterium]|nr:hypothetical protein [Patescibacteria group bacterium]
MSWTCLRESTPAARKDHRCSWCGHPIPKGARYVYSSGIWEGRFVVNKMHPECDVAAADDFRESGEGFTPYDNERPNRAFTQEGTRE